MTRANWPGRPVEPAAALPTEPATPPPAAVPARPAPGWVEAELASAELTAEQKIRVEALRAAVTQVDGGPVLTIAAHFEAYIRDGAA